MARRGPRREDGRALQRRGPIRDPLPVILVVCEGKVTEREYIEEFRLAHGVTTVRVHVIAPGGDPKALVEHAVALRDSAAREARRTRDMNAAYDEAWCVCDVDAHARLAEAQQIAARSGVRIAVSNPCFELWLLLHFADQTAHLNAAQAVDLVKRHLARYDKHLRFRDVADGYPDAVRRAEALRKRHEELGSAGGNPSTGVYVLTERIRQYSRSARL
jgi:hypothetical protein